MEYRVTYKRLGWEQAQSRVYQSEQAAQDFITNRLLGDERDDLAALVRLQVHTREVGPWLGSPMSRWAPWPD